MLNIQLNYSQFILLFYFLAINLVAFFVYGFDKLKSANGSRRVSEKMLWFMAFIGGSAGALISMQVFRHKTKKLSFQAILAIIILAQIWALVWLWK